MSTRLGPVALHKQGVNFVFTAAMEAIIRQLLHELSTPSRLGCRSQQLLPFPLAL